MDLSLGIPQGSVLGTLLFTKFISDLPSVITRCKVVMHADDTAFFIANRDMNLIEVVLQYELRIINNWFIDNELIVNSHKTRVLVPNSALFEQIIICHRYLEPPWNLLHL